MAIESKFQNVCLLAQGGMSSVYQVGRGIVVKVPNTDEFSRDQFCNELNNYKTLSEHTICAFIVQCFYYTSDGIFLEHMRDESLAFRIQANYTFDHKTKVVTHVEKLEPLQLRLKWTDDITQAIAFLETLDLAHGDLRPDNILLDGDSIKVTDFDNAATFGTPLMFTQEPWARELKACEKDYDVPGCEAGLLGPRTEQFALGSIFFYINYGMEPYGNQNLTDTPHDRGQELRKLLRTMQFPDLGTTQFPDLECDPLIDPLIDQLIYDCWHNVFPTIESLAVATRALFIKKCGDEERKPVDHGEDFKLATARDDTKQAFCRDLESQGLFSFLRTNSSN